MSSQRLYLAGAGGHGRELGWLARLTHPNADLVYLVDDERYLREDINGIPVRLLQDMSDEPGNLFVTAVGDSALRRIWSAALEEKGLVGAIMVHPNADLAPTVQLAEGAVVASGSILTDNVRIGRHAHVNVGCTISHDVVVGDFATISPGVHVAGHVSVGESAFVGIGASIRNGSECVPLTVGVGAFIAAGACVTTHVPPGTTVGGVPATPLWRGNS